MKTKRFVSTLLALLLICSLPVSAFAMDNSENSTIGETACDIENNYGVIFNNQNTVTTNQSGGIVETNFKTVTDNYGEVSNNCSGDPNNVAKVENNYGTVTTNSSTGTVTTNNGTVTTNNGTVTDNYKTVDDNYGTVTTNGSEATKNDAEVNNNYGTVTTNNGTVFKNGTEANHDKAIVETNNYFVEYNYGTVTDNYHIVQLNYGTVTTNNGSEEDGVYTEVGENHGTITTNEGFVNSNGTWDDHDKAIVETNNHYVRDNNGTVEINNGTVSNNINNGIVETNNGTVSYNYNNGTVKTNKGTVNSNGDTGTVSTNEGTVTENYGTVTTNEITGTVTNISGTVTTNYGTVNEADGTTHYGVQVDNEGDVSLAQKENGETWDLSQLFTKAGYVLTGFIQAYQTGENGLTQASTTVEGTSYTADCPNVLTLIWQAIVNPGSGEIAAAASDGAGSFGTGSVISINGHKFLLVAVVEDVYCLASVDSFEDEALSDLPALLASLLTEEQLSHVTGDPELLDEALTARFFAGQGSHIVFPCDKGLIFS